MGNVIRPYIIDNMINELRFVKFISVLVHSLKHKVIQLVHIFVSYFLPDVSIKNKILQFSKFAWRNV